MVSVTPTVDNTYGAIAVVVDWSSSPLVSGSGLVNLLRQTPDGVQTVVRGSPVHVSSGTALFWDDEAPLSTSLVYATSSPVVTGVTLSSPCIITGRGGDIGWLKDPVQPANDVPFTFGYYTPSCSPTAGAVQFADVAANQFADAGATFDLLNDPRPATVAALRKAATSSITLIAQQLTDETLLSTILASGRNLLLQLPTNYGWAVSLYGSDYVKVLGVTEDRTPLADKRHPQRNWQIPFTLAKAPANVPTGLIGSNGVGVGKATWGSMKASGLSWGSLKVTNKTWLQLAQGQGY